MESIAIATVEDLVRVLDQRPQWLEALRSRLLTRELLELPQKFAAFVEATERRFEVADRRFEVADRRFDSLERQLDQLRTDIAPIKAAHARNAAMREADLMVEEQGLTFVSTISHEEIRELVRLADTSGIPKHELRSFRLADMIMRAADPAGEECYVAAEVSYTANGRDTTRARAFSPALPAGVRTR